MTHVIAFYYCGYRGESSGDRRGAGAIKMLKAEGIPTLGTAVYGEHKGYCRRWQVRNMLRLTLIY